MRLPTEHEIDPYGDLYGDGQAAVRNFLGKSREQITVKFRAHGMQYQEDLMWMGPAAFCFYFPAAVAYLASSESRGDPDVASSLCAVIEFRLDTEAQPMREAFPDLLHFVDVVEARYEQYGICPEIYGDLQPRLRKIRERINEIF
jgi:hypothetical protein